MLTTFGVLTFTVGLQPGWLALGLVAVALVGGLVFVIAVGGLKPQLVLKVLRPFVKLADKILAKFKKPAIDESVERTIHNFSSAAHLITKNPRKTVQSFLWTTLSSICEMSCFVLVGFAFGVHHPEALICGYVVATLFAMISFVPQGVGVVEAAVTVAFALFGIDSATGLAVVIVYRGIVFWLPFLVGAVVIQRIKASGMSRIELKAGHTLVLCQLDAAPDGYRFSELTERCDLDPAMISRVLADLVRSGLVQKCGAPGKYNAIYRLTEAGRDRAVRVRAVVADVSRRADEGIDPGELAIFYKVLAQLTENLEAVEADPTAAFAPLED